MKCILLGIRCWRQRITLMVDGWYMSWIDVYCRTWELTGPWTGAQIQVPVKFIVGDLDITYHFEGAKEYIHKGGFKRDVPLLEEVVIVEDAGHFVHEERPHEINTHIHDFFNKFWPPFALLYCFTCLSSFFQNSQNYMPIFVWEYRIINGTWIMSFLNFKFEIFFFFFFIY